MLVIDPSCLRMTVGTDLQAQVEGTHTCSAGRFFLRQNDWSGEVFAVGTSTGVNALSCLLSWFGFFRRV